jgi:hypothetical protein
VDADDVVGLLADETRLRVAAAALLHPGTSDQIAAHAGAGARKTIEALTRLEAGGLLRRASDGRWQFVVESLREIARASRPEPDRTGTTPAEAILRPFVTDRRLTQIPAARSKRLAVLDRLAAEFEPGERYDERQVNETLRRWHDDVAALRRYLVDEAFLSRDHGYYWRTGGSVNDDA